VLDVAPAFTLKQAGGGRFALEKQLKEGPVVLVFFEKCG
jgi:peroxiredoxin